MTDHANELRRYSRKIGHPAGDVPSVMLAAAEEIERLAAKLEAAERERDECNRRRLEAADHFAAQTELMKRKYDDLRAKITEMEQQEPVATVIKEGDSRYWMSERLWTFPDGKYPLYALPGAKALLRVPDAVLAALDNLDDYIARIEGNDRGACNHINLLRRYLLDATEVGENK